MSTWSGKLARWGTRPAADLTRAGETLLAEARAAARLRGYRRDPDVAALTIEHTRERVERVLIVAMTCGLLYTTVNVQAFIAGTAASGVGWWAAWLVEPFVTTGVLALLRIEQVARREGVVPGTWVRRTRWAAFAVTYAFNTWAAWSGGDVQEIVKHSAIPVLVFFFAEALTDGRDALTGAAEKVAARIGADPDTVPVALPQPVVTLLPPPPVDEEPTKAYVEAQRRPQGQKPPKGWLKEVGIPQAYRALATEAVSAGRSLDTITLAAVDERAGTTKYATRAMITPLRERFEQENQEVPDGVLAQ